MRFLDGRAGEKMRVGFLPGALGGHIKTLETEICISRTYARKLLRRHNLNYEAFDDIQHAIDRGHCMKEDPYHLSFLHMQERIRPKIYFLLIKTNRRRDELWLVSFYRIQKPQFAKKLKPLQIIRYHAEDNYDLDE